MLKAMPMVLITGGAGFIGSNLVHHWMEKATETVINVDKLTYAGNLQNLAAVIGNPRHVFLKADIGDSPAISLLLEQYRPLAIVNLAAESHVDRSIHEPDAFIETNVVATFRLLKAVNNYWSGLSEHAKAAFRFVHVSTDEVYGSLAADDPPFSETTRYAPNSPYAASKAASDHLVRSFHHTFGLPAVTINCSNNYGPYQSPEKLIPLVIHRALSGQNLPIYGDGRNVRDWLHVHDHCEAIERVLRQGRPGETYNIGAANERTNLEVVRQVCAILDEEQARRDGRSYQEQITFVKDRPGHDRRYAIDASKIERELGWKAKETFESGLRKTVGWYLDNQAWIASVTSGAYRDWVGLQYGDRVSTA
jgi:dTDP-glucose 4,6-dehydratase